MAALPPSNLHPRCQKNNKEQGDKEIIDNGNEKLATVASRPQFGGISPMSVAARQSTTALSHLSRGNTSDTSARRPRSAHQHVAVL